VSIQKNNFEEERISLGFLIKGFKEWLTFLLSKAKQIIFGSVTILFFTICSNYLISPVHYARTTFVLENKNLNQSLNP
jgi:hypothetical protein